jgi:hypothetical protein
MTGLLEVLSGLVVAGAFLALAVIVSRRSHAGRESRAAGAARPSAALPQPAAEGRVQATFVPVPSRVPYDDGPLIGGPS